VLDAIAAYFSREIPTVAHTDADAFEEALRKAGLA
jgi:hypothetical protein